MKLSASRVIVMGRWPTRSIRSRLRCMVTASIQGAGTTSTTRIR